MAILERRMFLFQFAVIRVAGGRRFSRVLARASGSDGSAVHSTLVIAENASVVPI